jgi:hypothetical protein
MTDLVARLRSHVACEGGDLADVEQAADEITRLRAEVEALRADAKRYKFLRDDFSPMGMNIDGNHAWAYRRNATLKGPNLDAAIDAARKA